MLTLTNFLVMFKTSLFTFSFYTVDNDFLHKYRWLNVDMLKKSYSATIHGSIAVQYKHKTSLLVDLMPKKKLHDWSKPVSDRYGFKQ